MEICHRHQVPHAAGGYCPACVAAMALAEDLEAGETPIATLGDYELISELGRGGMGVVYLARQTSLNRRVALKLLPSGSLAGNEFIQRFRRESELAASLRHSNIVRIFEAGQSEGELFYSMELVSGGSLADWRDGKTQQPAGAAKLLHTIALAVAHAHRHGILHRDLKPANVLIDEDGQPKVADFGLARALDSPGDLTLATRSFGSPAYMAPELMRDPHAASPASDIYSLGAICYFLISGRSPFVSASLEELLRQVRECEPASPRVLDPSIPRDLQKICLKALDKSPAKRYATAFEMAEDLQRFLDGRPVLARPVGPTMKLYRLARRSPWMTAAIGLITVTLIGGIAGIAGYARLADHRAAESARTTADLRSILYASDIGTASIALRRGDTLMADEVLARWAGPTTDPDLRGFEWSLLKRLSQPTPFRPMDHRHAAITDVAISEDGRQLAVSDQSGHLLIHPMEGDAPASTLPWPAETVGAIPAAFGGGWVINDSGGTLRWVDPGGHLMREARGRQCSLAISKPRAIFSPVPRFHWWVKAGSATVIDWKSGEVLRQIPGDWRQAILSPDGKTAALAGAYGGLQVMDIGTGTVRELPTTTNVWALAFSRDGQKLAAGSRKAAMIWDLGKGASPPRLIPHALTVWMTGFSVDGKQFLTASSDRRVRVWKTANLAARPITLSGPGSEVWCATFSPDGSTITAGGKDGDVLRWALADPEPARPVMIHDAAQPPVISPDGRLLLTRDHYRSVLHHLKSHTTTPLPEGLNGIGFSADSKTLVVCDKNSRTGRLSASLDGVVTFHEAPVPEIPTTMLRTIADGAWIVRVLANGEISLERPVDGRPIHRLKGPVPGMRHAVAGSVDGRWAAVCGDGSPALTLHDLTKSTARSLEPVSAYYYTSCTFSPDGRWVAAGDLSGPIRVWETATGRHIATLPGHPEETSAVAFSPDGRTLASMGFHQDLKLWHLATWREIHSVDLSDAAHCLIFSPDASGLLFTRGRMGNETIEWVPGSKD